MGFSGALRRNVPVFQYISCITWSAVCRVTISIKVARSAFASRSSTPATGSATSPSAQDIQQSFICASVRAPSDTRRIPRVSSDEGKEIESICPSVRYRHPYSSKILDLEHTGLPLRRQELKDAEEREFPYVPP